MPDYKLGKVYKIVNTVNDKIYVGSTCKKLLSQRMCDHRANCRDEKRCGKSLLYQEMKDVGIDTFSIILIELYPCTTIDELTKKEQEYITELKPALNMVCAHNPPDWKKYYQEHKETRIATSKKSREKNLEKVMERQKKYYERNKEKILERQKNYHEKNKDEINKRRRDRKNKISTINIEIEE